MNNNISIISDNKCFGCTACLSICPVKAIEMHDNKKGFLSPYVNPTMCSKCGLCLKVCPVDEIPQKTSITRPKVFAIMHKNELIRSNSTSGGAFAALVDALPNNAIVYGAATLNKKIEHIRVEGKKISPLHGSKYVASNMNYCITSVENDLVYGNTVLFCGTPCQCGGIRKYFMCKKINTNNLYLIDFICHGTTSPKIFQDYIEYCEKKRGAEIDYHVFRSKVSGWHAHIEENHFKDGTVDRISFESQMQKAFFYSGLLMRDSCYNCPYTSIDRCSDITLGDFWSSNSSIKNFDDNKGLSLVIINNEKGKILFNNAKSHITYRDASIEQTEQPHLYHPIDRPRDTDDFWVYYTKKGFRKTIVKYFAAGKLRRMLSNFFHQIYKR